MTETYKSITTNVTATILEKRLQFKGFKQEKAKLSEVSQYYYDSIPENYKYLTENLPVSTFRNLIKWLEELFEESNLTTYEKFMVILPTFSSSLREKYFEIVKKYHNIILDYNITQFIDILACVCNFETYVLGRFNRLPLKTVKLRRFETIDTFLRGVMIALDDSELVLKYIKKLKCRALSTHTGYKVYLEEDDFCNKIKETLLQFKQIKEERRLLSKQDKPKKENGEIFEVANEAKMELNY